MIYTVLYGVKYTTYCDWYLVHGRPANRPTITGVVLKTSFDTLGLQNSSSQFWHPWFIEFFIPVLTPLVYRILHPSFDTLGLQNSSSQFWHPWFTEFIIPWKHLTSLLLTSTFWSDILGLLNRVGLGNKFNPCDCLIRNLVWLFSRSTVAL